MAKHTPGPWELVQYEQYHGFSIWANGAGCIAERWYASEHEEAPILENARLIAAAPELLEFSKAIVRFDEDGYDAAEFRRNMDSLKAAIKKATVVDPL